MKASEGGASQAIYLQLHLLLSHARPQVRAVHCAVTGVSPLDSSLHSMLRDLEDFVGHEESDHEPHGTEQERKQQTPPTYLGLLILRTHNCNPRISFKRSGTRKVDVIMHAKLNRGSGPGPYDTHKSKAK